MIITSVQFVFFLFTAAGASTLSGRDCLGVILFNHQSCLSHVHSGKDLSLLGGLLCVCACMLFMKVF